MLLNFGAKNFCCFKEGIEISLELTAKCPETISRGKSVANLLCVKGANGSGKTSALKILAFLKHFCCNSFNNKPEQKILVDSFFMNDDPIDIFCDFVFDNIQYSYELCLNEDKIISEKLLRKVNRLSKVFERKENKVTSCIKEFKELRKVKQRANASFISSARQYEVKSIDPIYNFFKSIISNLAWFGRVDFPLGYREVSKHYKDSTSLFNIALSFLKDCDLGISDIKINKGVDEDGSEYYFPIFVHDTESTRNELTYYNQSLGTRTLFRTLPYYFYTLKYGGTLVMDEFDTDFHPHMLKKLVSLFDNEEANVNNAQIVFSTHNTGILEYLGKYRTVLINKESSESYGYRLDEIPGDIIRNDRLIAPVYNSGKIGGIPRI